MKMIEQHNNHGSDPESQVAVQQVSGTNKAQLAFGVCVRLPNKACGSNRTMNVKKQAEATKRFLDLRHTH